jgi:Protein of unknown function (DUF2637)
VARTSDTHPDGEAATPGGAAPHLGAGPAASDRQGSDGGRVLRVLALIAVAVGLAGLTAAACVLSYSSIHHLAIQAGVHGRLASVYPLIFDALLVVAGCSVLALRGAGLVSRAYSWLCMLVLLAALATGGALRAAAVTIPHKTAAVVAAVVPWALVLIGFGLLLALLRYARLRRPAKRDGGQEGGAGGSADVAETKEEPEPDGDFPQRPLIPGLALKPRAIPAQAAPRVQEAVGQTGKNADDAALLTAATVPQADASSGGSGVEPPTVPGYAVPAQASPAANSAAGEPAAAPTAGTETWLRPEVRRADLQLRARMPKQAEQDAAGAHPAPPGWPAPFMPNVGAHGAETGPSPATQHEPAGQHEPAEGHEPAAEADADEPVRPATPGETTATALPKRVQGQQPVTSGLQPAAGPTNPRSPSDQTLSPAPTHDVAEHGDGLPAFQRTRSTPTPPQGDEPPGDEPQEDAPQEDEERS